MKAPADDRRAIEDLKHRTFIGMQIFYDLLEAANNKDRYNPFEFPYCSERDKGLVCALFSTGGRAVEVAQLRKGMFSTVEQGDGEYVKVTDMPLAKRFKRILQRDKEGRPLIDSETRKRIYITRKQEAYRSFAFPRDEPLAELLMEYVDSDYVDDYLFPTRRNIKRPHLHPTRINQIIDNLCVTAGHTEEVKDKQGNLVHRNGKTVVKGILWPHRIRSERASYLGKVKAWDTEKLRRWFSWETEDMALKYAHKSVEDMMTWF